MIALACKAALVAVIATYIAISALRRDRNAEDIDLIEERWEA